MKDSVYEEQLRLMAKTNITAKPFSFIQRVGFHFDAMKNKDRLLAKTRITGTLPYTYFRYKSTINKAYLADEVNQNHEMLRYLNEYIAQMNHILLKPGEVFSIWEFVTRNLSKSSKRKIYKNESLNHAINRISNQLYWMILHTPITVIERHRHIYDLYPDQSRQRPFGTGATCIYNYTDLKIQNQTDSVYQILMYIKGNQLIGEVRSLTQCRYQYDVFEERSAVQKNIFGHYIRHNTIYRKVIDSHSLKTRLDYITENHSLMKYDPLATGFIKACELLEEIDN